MAKGKKGKGDKKNVTNKGTTRESKLDLPVLHHGVGSFTLPNGDKYEGEYCAHRLGLVWREGNGVYTTHDGQIYEGVWKDDTLLENEEVAIAYPNGHVFYGRLGKSKYNGPGTYIIRDDIVLSMCFLNNQPNGETIMIDKFGHLWHGTAIPEENSCVYRIQNYFFDDIPDGRGQGLPKVQGLPKKKLTSDPQVIPPSPSTDKSKSKDILKRKSSEKQKLRDSVVINIPLIEEEVTEEQRLEKERKAYEERMRKIFDRDKERRIFAKTKKTRNDIDFLKSEWYQNYLKFLVTKEEILKKLEIEGIKSLTKQEKKWCKGYKEYVELDHLCKVFKEMEKKDSNVDVSLLKKFKTDEISKPIKVFQPRKNWDLFYDKVNEWWNDKYIPASRSDVDIWDSSMSSAAIRKLLHPMSFDSSSDIDEAEQTFDELKIKNFNDIVTQIAKL